MSLGNTKIFRGVQEALFLALMLVAFFSLFYIDIGIMYKIGIAVIAFAIVFLMTLATQILQQQKDVNKQQAA